ncbi:TetR/AcrR family transcriptional regulator [Duganella dendranthematis]|uniref:TetR/AcrR family transcriptional regulator n=1 Tax=Duganella dendranthematis TaxID=2728021 RepID=A0ABX6M8E2_9BURK|nr:TetR/AcrR family transcriptional regulator [Duganella dendranthematis]QJD90591.1 TetR/AcrR family transcriptional regulator [Duganella dendranthematis]
MASDKKQEVMLAARLMVQAQGYNALSFRDLAEAVGVKSSSIHYYFPTKGDLGAALARQYTDEFMEYLNSLVEQGLDWHTCVAKYAEVFRDTLLRENRMCMAGVLAAERPSLAPEVKAEVERFTEHIVGWLARVVKLGHPRMGDEAVKGRAFAIFSAIEGAQLVARGCDDVKVFDSTLIAYKAAGLLP